MASGTTLQGFPPLLPAGPIAALILGSFPSVVSLRTGEYYGNPQNWFWRVLQACGVIPDADAPYDERVSALTSLGIAVWDLYATVEREGSGDDRIGNFRGDCPAWVETPPEPAWRDERGQVGTAADAKTQAGI